MFGGRLAGCSLKNSGGWTEGQPLFLIARIADDRGLGAVGELY